MNLGEIMEFLVANPDQMYITESETIALVYYPPTETVIAIDGDFSGNEEDCNRELQKGLEMFKHNLRRSKAHLN